MPGPVPMRRRRAARRSILVKGPRRVAVDPARHEIKVAQVEMRGPVQLRQGAGLAAQLALTRTSGLHSAVLPAASWAW
jgi:hypothetical protein